MKLFQNSGVYPAYRPRLRHLTRGATTFAARMRAFLDDRFGAPHFLAPVLDGDADAFFTNGDDECGQRLWAREQGMPARTALDTILLAQLEAHRTEVFYNLDPLRHGPMLVRRLPGSVRRAICWRAAPSPGADLSGYHAVVSNFPSILATYVRAGWNTAWFAPAHDPVMDRYADAHRDVDVVFVGGYSRHHRRRARLLEAVAAVASSRRVVLHLDRSRATRLAESWPGRLLPLAVHRRPAMIQRVSRPPVFGRDLYSVLARARIVINGAIDMAGEDRGNMRCFEALGLGALLLTDSGRYPDGMEDGSTLVTYTDPDDAVRRLEGLLEDEPRRSRIARAGRDMVATRYSKAAQWARFQSLVQ